MRAARYNRDSLQQELTDDLPGNISGLVSAKEVSQLKLKTACLSCSAGRRAEQGVHQDPGSRDYDKENGDWREKPRTRHGTK